MDPQGQAFLDAIKKDPLDGATRLIFADWLEERGEDDEAQEQRRQATPEWQQAYIWMTVFIERHVEEFDLSKLTPEIRAVVEVTVEKVLEAGRKYLRRGTRSVLSGLGFGAQNALYADDEAQGQFWKCYEILTGKKISKNRDPGNPFTCAC